jgi:hypothetical protein
MSVSRVKSRVFEDTITPNAGRRDYRGLTRSGPNRFDNLDFDADIFRVLVGFFGLMLGCQELVSTRLGNGSIKCMDAPQPGPSLVAQIRPPNAATAFAHQCNPMP